MPNCKVEIAVSEGQRLSQLRDQDSYSYEVATIFVGGDSEEQLQQSFDDCRGRLPLVFE